MLHGVIRGFAASLELLCFSVAVACSSNPEQNRADTNDTPDDTAGCATLPRDELFPIIGAFIGPDPGPCTVSRSGSEYVFDYDAYGRLVRQVSADATDSTLYSYEQGLLVRETRTWMSGVAETTYQYLDANIRTITVNPDASATGYEYDLDERGYIRKARLLNVVSSPSIPVRYTYEYADCALQWRVAYDPNDAVNLNETVKYSYDAEHRLTTRTSVASEERFDYSCW